MSSNLGLSAIFWDQVIKSNKYAINWTVFRMYNIINELPIPLFEFVYIVRKFLAKKRHSNAEIVTMIPDQKFENEVIVGYDI